MTRRISVQIVGDSASLERSFQRSKASAEGFNSSVGRLRIGLGSLVKSVLVVDAVQKTMQGLEGATRIGIDAFAEQARASAQTAAAIKSTGGAANVTAGQIEGLAGQLSNLSGQAKPAIQSAENVLLSFTRIRNFAGKGNDVFTQATKAVVDFSARTGKDAKTAAVIFGRALDDPATKLAGLSRAGIVFTKSQIASIKAIEKTKGVLAAQEVVLKDLRERYAGAAKAAGETLPGELDRLRQKFREFAGGIVGDVQDPLKRAATALNAFFDRLGTATTFRSKLNVVFTGAEEAGRAAEKALRGAIAKVDWNKVWSAAGGIADGLRNRLQAVDWSKVGKSIGDGIAKSISVAASATKAIAGKLENIFKAIDFEKLGKAAGPGLATAIVTAFTTLTDPTFWIKHWDLALSVAAVAFSGPLGKLGGKLIAPFSRIGIRLAEDLALVLPSAVEKLGKAIEGIGGPIAGIAGRLIQRVGSVLLDGFLKLPGLVGRALEPLTGFVSRAFGRLSALSRFGIKVLGIQAVVDEIAKLVRTVGGLFSNLAKTVGHALDNAWKALERSAIKAAIDILDPFSSLPGGLGGWARKAKAQLQTQLDGMVTASQQAAAQMNAAFGSVKPPAGLVGPATAANQKVAPAFDTDAARKAAAAAAGNAAALAQLPPPPPAPGNAGLTAQQRNTFFDNAISSDLTRAGFVKSIKGQISALQTIAGLISARIAATKDVTRRRTLEDQLLGLESQIAGDRQQLAQSFLDALSFKVTKAQATASFKDDIAALDALKAGIESEIKTTGDTLALEQQLFDVRQQLVTARNNQRNAVQFKAIGLTATGNDVTPGVKTLKAELNKVGDALKGTFLDTSKTESLLSQIKKVLAGGLGEVGQVVRAKIQTILDGLEQQLKNHNGNLTKFRHASSSALLAGLGLSPEQERELRGRISQIGAGGTMPSRGPAFSLAGAGATSSAAAGGGAGMTFVLHNPTFNGVTDIARLQAELIKRAGRRSGSRRGPSAGR